jgi:hypothetical protein
MKAVLISRSIWLKGYKKETFVLMTVASLPYGFAVSSTLFQEVLK